MSAPTHVIGKLRDENSFLKTRARLQRLTDSKFCSGWVESLSMTEAVIKLKMGEADFTRGEQFSVEVNGKEGTAVFIGELLTFSCGKLSLALPKGVAVLPKKETARVSLNGFAGTLNSDGTEHPFSVVDISDTGLGLLSPDALEKDSKIEFDLVTPTGTIHGSGMVMYCRNDPDAPNQQRVGVKLDELSRIERARWQRLMSGEVAA